MPLEQVHAFYEKVASDESFRSRIQSVSSKEECSEIVKTAGFNFTQQEFEEYTERLLESDRPDEEVQDLSEEELVTIAGGFIGDSLVHACYGLPYPDYPIKDWLDSSRAYPIKDWLDSSRAYDQLL